MPLRDEARACGEPGVAVGEETGEEPSEEEPPPSENCPWVSRPSSSVRLLTFCVLLRAMRLASAIDTPPREAMRMAMAILRCFGVSCGPLSLLRGPPSVHSPSLARASLGL